MAGILSNFEQQYLPASAKNDLKKRQDTLGKSGVPGVLSEAAKEMYDNPAVNSAIGFTPIVGDVQSGAEAIRALSQGNIGEGLLNAVGVLPFVPALGTTLKNTPMWYHGTKQDFPQFQGTTYVTQDPEFASMFATGEAYSKGKPIEFTEGARILPLNVNVNNPFDYENPDHVNKVISKLIDTDKPGVRGIKPGYFEGGHWSRIEDKDVQKAIRQLGFDSFYVNENGVKNLGVYDPSSSIKSVFDK